MYELIIRCRYWAHQHLLFQCGAAPNVMHICELLSTITWQLRDMFISARMSSMRTAVASMFNSRRGAAKVRLRLSAECYGVVYSWEAHRRHVPLCNMHERHHMRVLCLTEQNKQEAKIDDHDILNGALERQEHFSLNGLRTTCKLAAVCRERSELASNDAQGRFVRNWRKATEG